MNEVGNGSRHTPKEYLRCWIHRPAKNNRAFYYMEKDVIIISPVSEAKKRANKKWQDANCKRVQLVIPNEEAEIIENYCSEKNISKNGFFREAAKEKIEREK